MNKTEKILAGIIAIVLLSIGAVLVLSKKSSNLGSLYTDQNAYSAAATYSTTTLTNNVAASVLSRATSSRSFARICAVSSGEVTWLYKQATSTGVAVGKGTPVYATSGTAYPQIPACATFDQNDPYLGQVWGIVSATTTISVEVLQE